MAETHIDALLFDKDGTLFHFHDTWSRWMARVIDALADDDTKTRTRIADAIDFDLERGLYRDTSPVIAGTNREFAELIAQALERSDIDTLEAHLAETSACAEQAEAVPLKAFFTDLAARRLRIGLMTNDSESTARTHLDRAGVTGHFDMIIGYDSGFGAKPDPAPLLAFARAMTLPPPRVAMVGDSTHDLMAGRAAGMQTVAVLTGAAPADTLAPYADVILPDIGHIPGWLAT